MDGDGGDWLPVFPTDWDCPVCGQINTEDHLFCVSCRLPRPAEAPDPSGHSEP